MPETKYSLSILKQNEIGLDPINSKLYSEVDGLSLQNLFYVKNKTFPNCMTLTTHKDDKDPYIDTDELLEAIKNGTPEDENLKYLIYSAYTLRNGKEEMGFSVIFEKSNVYARIERSPYESYILYNNDGRENAIKFATFVRDFYKEEKIEQDNIFLIAHSGKGFHLNAGKIKPQANFSVQKHYNDDFEDADVKIKEFVSNDKSGLCILHGLKGSGKSTYIRNLVTTNPEKKFVYLPPNLINMFGSPEFSSFLFTLSDSVIIMEDCEVALKSREEEIGNSSAVSILLNMCDGLMSDLFNIKFICTFNTELENIDDALTRKGRLHTKYKFNELNADKTLALLKELYGEDKEFDVPKKGLALCDIFNYYSESYDNKKRTKIGL